MLAGHFGLAAIVKSREPQVPLWALMLSTQLLDAIFIVLYAFKIETFENVPGTAGGYGELVIHADYTHSLVGALAISLVAMLVAAIPWGRRNGIIMGAMVFSHWILDILVHRGDMPILPGNAYNLPKVGLGLWMYPWLTAGMELIFVLAGAFLYYHASMRTAIKAERQDTKAGTPLKGNYRRQALTTSIVLFIVLLGTLVGNFLGY